MRAHLLHLARKVTAVRLKASERSLVTLSLGSARPPGERCPCRAHPDAKDRDIRELSHASYGRQQILLIPSQFGYGGGSGILINEDNVTFAPYDGEFPVVVTHITLRDMFDGRKITSPLNSSYTLQPGDCMSFPRGAIRAPGMDQWEPA